MTDPTPALTGVVARISSVLGAGFGATVGAQMGDPVSGAMVGEALAQVGGDFADRILSPRQEARIASVLDYAGELIVQGIAEGRTLRDDGFFDAPHLDATEVFEGILLVARDEHESKKLPYVAKLMSSIAFDETVTVPTANLLIAESDQLSWLQMCLLAIVARPDEFPLPDVNIGTFGTNWGDWTVSHTFHRMMAPEGAFFQSPERADDGSGFPGYDLSLSRLKLSNQGELVAGALGLGTVPAEEVMDVHSTLVELARLRHEKFGDD